MTNNKKQHRYQTILLYEQRLMGSKTAAEALSIKERQFLNLQPRRLKVEYQLPLEKVAYPGPIPGK